MQVINELIAVSSTTKINLHQHLLDVLPLYQRCCTVVQPFIRALYHSIVLDRKNGLNTTIYNQIDIKKTMAFISKQPAVIDTPRTYFHTWFFCAIDPITQHIRIVEADGSSESLIPIRSLFEWNKSEHHFDVPLIRQYAISKEIMSSKDILLIDQYSEQQISALH